MSSEQERLVLPNSTPLDVKLQVSLLGLSPCSKSQGRHLPTTYLCQKWHIFGVIFSWVTWF